VGKGEGGEEGVTEEGTCEMGVNVAFNSYFPKVSRLTPTISKNLLSQQKRKGGERGKESSIYTHFTSSNPPYHPGERGRKGN